MDANNTNISAGAIAKESAIQADPKIEAPNTTAEAKDAGAQEAIEEKKQEQIAKKIKQLKLKVDGKEIVEDLPFEIDENPEIIEYMQKQLQLAKAAQKRMSEASEYKKRLDGVGAYLEELKTDPKKFRALAKDLGIDEKTLAAQIIEEELERAQKSPEQLAKEQMEAELKALKDEREREKKEFEQREFERLQEQQYLKYDQMISEALDGSTLPKSKAVVARMANYMMLALENNVDVDPKDLVPLIEQDLQSELQEVIKLLGVDKAEQFIGKDVISAIRKKSVAKAKEVPPVLNQAVKDTGGKPVEKPSKKKQSFKDYFR